MSKLSYEETVEAAKPIKEMAELARTLNVDYLTECLEQMKSQHSFRDSAMILSPSPFTVMEQQDLDKAKIKGLDLMLQLAKNQNEIFEATVRLARAKGSADKLAGIFGM